MKTIAELARGAMRATLAGGTAATLLSGCASPDPVGSLGTAPARPGAVVDAASSSPRSPAVTADVSERRPHAKYRSVRGS